jgi:hypothetical protein
MSNTESRAVLATGSYNMGGITSPAAMATATSPNSQGVASATGPIRLVGQAHQRQGLCDPFLNDVARSAVEEARCKVQRLTRRHLGVEAGLLGQVAYAPPDLDALALNVETKDSRTAARGLDQPEQ